MMKGERVRMGANKRSGRRGAAWGLNKSQT